MVHSLFETSSFVEEGWLPQRECLHSHWFLVTTAHHQVEQLDGTPKEYPQIIIEAICSKVGDFYNKPDVLKNNGQFISNGHSLFWESNVEKYR